MFKKHLSSFTILFLLSLMFFSLQACKYKKASFFSPMGDIEDPAVIIPSLTELEGSYDINYLYTQNTCDNQSGEFDVLAGIHINPTNNWIDVQFSDAPAAIGGPYNEDTGNFMGETPVKPIGEGFTAQEVWDVDFYPMMNSSAPVAFGGISEVNVWSPDNSLACGVTYNVHGEKTSGELPPAFYALTVEKEGNGFVGSGGGAISCGDDCVVHYEEGTEVTLTAEPDEGWEFDGWSDDVPDSCSDDSESCTIIMDGVKTVTATFVQKVLFFPNPLICIEHDDDSQILWWFIFDQIFGGGNTTIVMRVYFPDESFEDIEIETLEEFLEEIRFILDINNYGLYDWEITEAYYTDSGKEIPIDGTTNGQVNVGPDEQNEGQCTE